MTDYGYVRLYGYRPKPVTSELQSRLYASPVCDDSAAKAAFAAATEAL